MKSLDKMETPTCFPLSTWALLGKRKTNYTAKIITEVANTVYH